MRNHLVKYTSQVIFLEVSYKTGSTFAELARCLNLKYGGKIKRFCSLLMIMHIGMDLHLYWFNWTNRSTGSNGTPECD